MLFALILLGLIVALFFLAPKKDLPPIPDTNPGEDQNFNASPQDRQATKTDTRSSPSAITRFHGELIEPTDKRITKALAAQLYAEALRLASPTMSEKSCKFSVSFFVESINFHRSMLEQQTPTWEIDDLIENIEALKNDLFYELEDEEIETQDHDRIDWLRQKIKLRSSELAELKAKAKKYKNRDLRYFLASELNHQIHRIERDETEIIAQKTHEYWANKPTTRRTTMANKSQTATHGDHDSSEIAHHQ